MARPAIMNANIQVRWIFRVDHELSFVRRWRHEFQSDVKIFPFGEGAGREQ